MPGESDGYAQLFDQPAEPIDALLGRMSLHMGAMRGTRVLLTGGARGIGLEVVRGLLCLGAQVLVVDIRRTDALAQLQARYARRLQCLQIDLCAPDAIEQTLQAGEAHLGEVDLLINNAAHLHDTAPMTAIDGDDWARTFEINTHVPVALTRRLLPGMVRRGRGTVVFLMSLEGSAYWSGYCASKAAMRSLSFSLAAELPRAGGVHVFSFAPKLVATELVRDAGPALANALGMEFEQFVTEVATTPGYSGMMPPTHTAAGLIDALRRPEHFHGLIADGIQALNDAGIITLPEDACAEPLEEPVSSPEQMTHYVSGVSELNEHIERRVRWQTRALELESAELRAQKLSSLGVLAAGIAHDFNNLLTGISANLELAAADGRDALALRDAKLATERASELVRLMLNYAGKGRLKKDSADLNAILIENLQLARGALRYDVEVNLELADALPQVEADAGQLQQVIMNLLLNAVEAIPAQGNVWLRTRTQTLAARDTFFAAWLDEPLPAGRYVVVEVEDTGQGMTPEIISQIFDPFYTTKFIGRGMGLSAVLGIVRQHGGGLHVHSTPGRGTTFQIALPVAAAGTTDAEPDADAPAPVLIIDDDPFVRRTLGRIIQHFGLPVLSAASGTEGLELLRSTPRVRRVFLDLMMPGVDGVETLRRLRVTHPDLPVCVTSGYSEQRNSVALARLGHDGFLAKPFGLTAVRAVLAGDLDG